MMDMDKFIEALEGRRPPAPKKPELKESDFEDPDILAEILLHRYPGYKKESEEAAFVRNYVRKNLRELAKILFQVATNTKDKALRVNYTAAFLKLKTFVSEGEYRDMLRSFGLNTEPNPIITLFKDGFEEAYGEKFQKFLDSII